MSRTPRVDRLEGRIRDLETGERTTTADATRADVFARSLGRSLGRLVQRVQKLEGAESESESAPEVEVPAEDEVQDEAATTTDPSLNAPVPTMAEDDGDAGWCFDYDDEDGGSDDNGNNGRTNSDEEVREDAYFSFYGSDSDCSYG